MQNFLPYESFQDSAEALDSIRLGNQRNETYICLRANCLGPICCRICGGKISRDTCLHCGSLEWKKTGWYNHPAVKMWRGYESALFIYGLKICSEYSRRGYEDQVYLKFQGLSQEFSDLSLGTGPLKVPFWIGEEEFHLSHQSQLLQKDLGYYSKIFPGDIPKNLPYVWPN